MPINSDKPHLWKQDIAASVDQFNKWFRKFAPKAYRESRHETTKRVEHAMRLSRDWQNLNPGTLTTNPEILPVLRMATCPPLARDRLVGLAGVGKGLVNTMEEGAIPIRMGEAALADGLKRICSILNEMLDVDLFPWLAAAKQATRKERHRAATVVADRLCGAVTDPLVRNAQEKRQLEMIGNFLKQRGYIQKPHPAGRPPHEMEPGTYSIRLNLVVGQDRFVNIPIDVVIQPKRPRRSRMPILIEAKSAGDFTNVNKRRKEEATKAHQLKAKYGPHVEFILFLCGYFDSGYLGYEAAEGIDWIWEHRIEDLDALGLTR